MVKKDINYVLIFVIGIVIVLAIHYFVILRLNLHPTLQVLVSFLLFWAWLTIVSLLRKDK